MDFIYAILLFQHDAQLLMLMDQVPSNEDDYDTVFVCVKEKQQMTYHFICV